MDQRLGEIKCKYYDVDQFCSLSVSNQLSLFHTNIISLTKHYDELKALIGKLGHDFSVIGITETGFQNGIPTSNCDLPNLICIR